MTPEVAEEILLELWDQIGEGDISVDEDFKRSWNKLADIAREKFVVPKYPTKDERVCRDRTRTTQ